MKVRLDKYLANLGIGSRKEVTGLIKKGYVKVNDEVVYKSDMKITENDKIEFMGEEILVKDKILVLLHKPAGYVSSDIDEANYPSYKHLLEDCPYKNLLKVAGRLDVYTEGLLVLSSDGSFIHSLISPKKEKEKVYYVELQEDVSESDLEKLKEGVDIGDYITKPARFELVENGKIKENIFSLSKKTLSQIPEKLLKGKQALLLGITEGKFHQIKRMFEALNNKVVYLKRLKMDKFELEDLAKGEWKMLEDYL